ncbi:MAG: STAS domain-containing protein [Leptolyngbyaceae cyanobacterium bins.302]|nr:STAS domain-containing protein [Leptolyngbyaceae cyanobacterium bins.302]
MEEHLLPTREMSPMRSLLTNTQIISEAVVIQPEGALNAATVMQFHHKLHLAVSSTQPSTLLVDLKQVDQIDSAGLMALVSAFKLAKKFNKRFLLCSVSSSVRMILELTQLDKVFEIIDGSNIADSVSNSLIYPGSQERELAMTA